LKRWTSLVTLPIAIVAALQIATAALANPEFYTIDPQQSFLQIDPSATVSLPIFPLFPPVDMPLVTQVGRGGFGGTLPDGSSSDGLRTSLSGHLLVDVNNNATQISIVNRRTSARLGNSGQWLPGALGSETVAANGALAARFEAPSLAFSGQVAIRGTPLLTFGHLGAMRSLTAQGGGVSTFSYTASDASTLAPRIGDGLFDYQTSLASLEAAAGRSSPFIVAAEPPFATTTTGELFQQPGGGRQVTLPIAFTLFLTDDSFLSGVPLSATLPLSGQIVATNRSFVPEPGAALEALVALVTLTALGALRRHRPRARASRARARLLASMLCVVALGGLGCPELEANTPSRPAAAGAPTCQPNGTSASVSAAGATDSRTGPAACGASGSSAHQPHIMTSSSGGTVDFLASADPNRFVNSFAVGYRWHVGWDLTVSGGPLASPAQATIHSATTWPYAPASGTGSLHFGASLETFKDNAGPVSGNASVQVDCGGGPTALALNGLPQLVPAQPSSGCGSNCSCSVQATLNGSTSAVGWTAQSLTIYTTVPATQCGSHEFCRINSPSTPFCVEGTGCTDGSAGMACNYDDECDLQNGIVCGRFGFCRDGSLGQPCASDDECALPLICLASSCG